MKHICILLISWLLCLACSEQDDEAIVGSWQYAETFGTTNADTFLYQVQIYEFMSNETYNYQRYSQKCDKDGNFYTDKRTFLDSLVSQDYSLDKQFIYLSATDEVLTYRVDGSILWLGNTKYKAIAPFSP